MGNLSNATAIVMGSGYVAGAYFFVRAAIGARWHQTSAAFLPIGVLSLAMLVATFLHWSRFDMGRPIAQAWLVL